MYRTRRRRLPVLRNSSIVRSCCNIVDVSAYRDNMSPTSTWAFHNALTRNYTMVLISTPLGMKGKPGLLVLADAQIQSIFDLIEAERIQVAAVSRAGSNLVGKLS